MNVLKPCICIKVAIAVILLRNFSVLRIAVVIYIKSSDIMATPKMLLPSRTLYNIITHTYNITYMCYKVKTVLDHAVRVIYEWFVNVNNRNRVSTYTAKIYKSTNVFAANQFWVVRGLYRYVAVWYNAPDLNLN